MKKEIKKTKRISETKLENIIPIVQLRVYWYIYKKIDSIVRYEKSKSYRIGSFLDDLLARENHRPMDLALHFLVHALAFDLKLYKGRTWQNRYIANFLSELTHKTYTAGNIKKKLGKSTPETILEKLAKLQRYCLSAKRYYVYGTRELLLPNNLPKSTDGFLSLICQALDMPTKKK